MKDEEQSIGRCIGLAIDKNMDIEKAIMKFKKKVKDSKLMLILKENSYYQKPSEKKRKKQNRWKLDINKINRDGV